MTNSRKSSKRGTKKKEDEELLEVIKKLMEENSAYRTTLQEVMNSRVTHNQSKSIDPIDTLAVRLPMFQPDPENGSTFSSWLERYQEMIDDTTTALEDDAKARLIRFKLDPKAFELLRDIISPRSPSSLSLQELVYQLKKLFDPARTIFARRFAVHQLEYNDEPLTEFTAKMKAAINSSRWREMSDDQFECLTWVCAFRDKKHEPLRQLAVRKMEEQPDLTLVQLMDIVKQTMTSREDIKMMSEERRTGNLYNEILAVDKPRHRQAKSNNADQQPNQDPLKNEESNETHNSKPKTLCPACRGNHWRNECPYQNHTCFSCGQKGHLRIACHRRRQINEVRSSSHEDHRIFKKVKINGTEIMMQLDTGADVTLISHANSRKLKNSSQLEQTTITLHSVNGTRIPVRGSFKCQFTISGTPSEGICYVTDTKTLLGLDWISANAELKAALTGDNTITTNRTRKYDRRLRTPAFRSEVFLGRNTRTPSDLIRRPETITNTGRRNRKMETQLNRHHGTRFRGFVINEPVYARDFRTRKLTWTPAIIQRRQGAVMYQIDMDGRIVIRYKNQLKRRRESINPILEEIDSIPNELEPTKTIQPNHTAPDTSRPTRKHTSTTDGSTTTTADYSKTDHEPGPRKIRSSLDEEGCYDEASYRAREHGGYLGMHAKDLVRTAKKALISQSISIQNYTQDDCQIAFHATTNSLMQTIRFMHIFFSLLGIISSVLFVKVLMSGNARHVHVNLRISLSSLSIAALLACLQLCFIAIYHLGLTFTAENACDVIYEAKQCALLRFPLVLSIYATLCGIIVLAIERTIATAKYKSYEVHGSKVVAVSLVTCQWVISIFFAAVSVLLRADPGYVHYCTPYVSHPRSSVFSLCVMSLLELSTLVYFVVLMQMNQHRQVNEFVNNAMHTLTERYQLQENVKTMRILIPSITVHAVLGFVGLSSMLAFAVFHRSVEERLIVRFAPFSEIVLLVIPVYAIVFSLVAVYRNQQLRHVARKTLPWLFNTDDNSSVRLIAHKDTVIVSRPSKQIEADSDTHFDLLNEMWKK